jgi:hypothetical protein
VARKSLERLGPEKAKKYGEAITEVTDWVVEQIREGNSEVYSDVLTHMMDVSERRGLPAEVWDYLDWDDLYFAAL